MITHLTTLFPEKGKKQQQHRFKFLHANVTRIRKLNRQKTRPDIQRRKKNSNSISSFYANRVTRTRKQTKQKLTHQDMQRTKKRKTATTISSFYANHVHNSDKENRKEKTHSPRQTGLRNDSLHPVEKVPVKRLCPAELVVDQLDLDRFLGCGDQSRLCRSGPEPGHEALSLYVCI